MFDQHRDVEASECPHTQSFPGSDRLHVHRQYYKGWRHGVPVPVGLSVKCPYTKQAWPNNLRIEISGNISVVLCTEMERVGITGPIVS